MVFTDGRVGERAPHGSRPADVRAAHAKYARERDRAIKNGTWKPHKAREPTEPLTAECAAWAAGYLEGEGSFRHDGKSIQVRCDSTDREPIMRLIALFGGGLSDGVTITSTGKPVYRWGANGDKARRAMAAIYHLMSPRRQAAIDRALAATRSR